MASDVPTRDRRDVQRVAGAALIAGQHVDLERTHQAEQIRLASEPADGEPQVRGVGRELPEGGIDGDPSLQPDLRPGVVVELAVEIRETGGDARRNPRRAR